MRQFCIFILLFGLSIAFPMTAQPSEITVSNEEIAQRANVLLENGTFDREESLRAATEQVTRETLLYNLAVREGLVMSPDAVESEMQAMWTLALADQNDTGRELFERAAASINQSVEDFLRNPEVVAAYQRLFTAGAMRLRLVERLQVPETASETAENAAVDEYLSHVVRVVPTQQQRPQ